MADDTTGQSALTVLQAPPSSPEGRAWGAQYLKDHPEGVDTTGEASLLQDYTTDADQARTALQAAREHLASVRMDPKQLGFSIASALLAPSRYGVGSQWSDAAKSVSDFYGQKQQLAEKQAQEDIPLAEKVSSVDDRLLQARLALQQLKERSQTSMVDTAIRATSKPDAAAQMSPIGKLVTDRLGAGALQTDEGRKLFDAYVDQMHPNKAAPTGNDEVAYGAYMLYKTGKMPPLGQGSAPTRAAMIAGAAQLAAREQNGEDITNPGFDQAIVNNQDFAASGRALSSFAGGPLGNQTRALNNSVGHLKLYEQLFSALQNGDIQLVNKLGNAWNKATGQPAPTTLDAMGQIIGPELTKILTTSNAGTKEEREQFAQTAGSLANSPEQTVDAIHAVRGMLGRQAADLAFQYHGATGRNDFSKRYLQPDVAHDLELDPHSAQQSGAGAAPAGNAALPPQAIAQLKEGYTTTFANGQKWTLQGGKPTQVQ